MKVEEFFLVHVNEGFVGTVLKRLRELDLEGDAQANHRDIMISFDESHRVASGHELRDRWKEMLLRTEREYHERKHRWRQSVGFEDGRWRGSFRVKAPTRAAMYQRMGDWSLGLSPLKVESLELAKVRFGIPGPPRVHEDATLEVREPPNVGDAVISFFDRENEERVSFDMATHSTAAIPGMPRKHHRVRFVCSDLAVTLANLHKKHPAITLEVPRPALGAEINLLRAQQIGGLVSLVRRSKERGLTIRGEVPSLDSTWEYELRDVPAFDDPAVELYGLTARAAARLFSEFGFDPNGATTRVDALVKDWVGLVLTSAARRPKPELDTLGVRLNGDRPPAGTVTAFAPRFALETNRGTLLGLAVFAGAIRHFTGDHSRIEIPRPRPIRTILKLAGDRARRARVENDIEDAVQELRATYEAVVG